MQNFDFPEKHAWWSSFLVSFTKSQLHHACFLGKFPNFLNTYFEKRLALNIFKTKEQQKATFQPLDHGMRVTYMFGQNAKYAYIRCKTIFTLAFKIEADNFRNSHLFFSSL